MGKIVDEASVLLTTKDADLQKKQSEAIYNCAVAIEKGGEGVEVVQEKGQSTTAVMSQKAVTDECNRIEDKIDDIEFEPIKININDGIVTTSINKDLYDKMHKDNSVIKIEVKGYFEPNLIVGSGEVEGFTDLFDAEVIRGNNYIRLLIKPDMILENQSDENIKIANNPILFVDINNEGSTITVSKLQIELIESIIWTNGLESSDLSNEEKENLIRKSKTVLFDIDDNTERQFVFSYENDENIVFSSFYWYEDQFKSCSLVYSKEDGYFNDDSVNLTNENDLNPLYVSVNNSTVKYIQNGDYYSRPAKISVTGNIYDAFTVSNSELFSNTVSFNTNVYYINNSNFELRFNADRLNYQGKYIGNSIEISTKFHISGPSITAESPRITKIGTLFYDEITQISATLKQVLFNVTDKLLYTTADGNKLYLTRVNDTSKYQFISDVYYKDDINKICTLTWTAATNTGVEEIKTVGHPLVQTTGNSQTDVMSQKAVTDAIKPLVLELSSVHPTAITVTQYNTLVSKLPNVVFKMTNEAANQLYVRPEDRFEVAQWNDNGDMLSIITKPMSNTTFRSTSEAVEGMVLEINITSATGSEGLVEVKHIERMNIDYNYGNTTLQEYQKKALQKARVIDYVGGQNNMTFIRSKWSDEENSDIIWATVPEYTGIEFMFRELVIKGEEPYNTFEIKEYDLN